MNNQHHAAVTGLLLLLSLSLFLAAPARAADEDTTAKITFDRWYVLLLGEDRVGYSHAWVEETDEAITSQMQMRIEIRRGPTVVEVAQSTKFVETPDGKPVKAGSTMRMAQTDVTQIMTWTNKGIELTTKQLGQERTKLLPPIEGDWLTPGQAERYVQKQIDKGAKAFSYRTIDIGSGPKAVEITARVLRETEVEVFGKVVPASEWELTNSAMPNIKVRQFVDARGREIKSTINLGAGMTITMLEADKQLALSEVDPPEMMVSTFITPDKPIENPRKTRKAVYRLTATQDDDAAPKFSEITLPRTGFQRVSWGDANTAIVAIDLDEPVNPERDVVKDEHRESSTMLDSEDAKIKELVKQALGDDADKVNDAEKAEKLRQFVHGYINAKDLSVGLATASEVARTKQGDCTEHGMLLAAMLRAAGVPSRTASGLVYADQFAGQRSVFAYHMWTQAWLVGERTGGRWVDLDATLPKDTPFDATHITLSTASLADDQATNDFVEMVPLIGRLQISVVEAR